MCVATGQCFFFNGVWLSALCVSFSYIIICIALCHWGLILRARAGEPLWMVCCLHRLRAVPVGFVSNRHFVQFVGKVLLEGLFCNLQPISIRNGHSRNWPLPKNMHGKMEDVWSHFLPLCLRAALWPVRFGVCLLIGGIIDTNACLPRRSYVSQVSCHNGIAVS